MKIKKTSGYANYGSIPQNEYTTANLEQNADATVVLGYELKPDDTAYKQRRIKQQAQHPSGKRRTRGWSRSWKANGWRAESAALQDESTGIRRYSDYVRKSSRPL